MAQTSDSTCLYTTVRNTSGVSAFFGFLGTHGKRLAANESYTQPGNLISKLGNTLSRRRFQSLETAVKAGNLAILSTPAVHLHDTVHDVVRVLSLHNDVLGHVDPCWETAGSAAFSTT